MGVMGKTPDVCKEDIDELTASFKASSELNY